MSQSKFYCKFCKCWIADNKPTRSLHDNGAKHKQNVELFHKEKREKQLHGARSERELQQQLADIEKAAAEALNADRSEHAGMFYARPSAPQIPPPPPPPAISKRSWDEMAAGKREQVNDEEDIAIDTSGIYEVRGQTYLEGKVHQDKLKKGTTCEIFIEADDEWLPAVVTSVSEFAVPNTDITIRDFGVRYETNQKVEVTEEKVKGDRLRLLADRSGKLLETHAKGEGVNGGSDGPLESEEVKEAPPVSADTGLGGWQTVEVEVFDEAVRQAEEAEAERVRVKEEAQAKEAKKLQIRMDMAAAREGDSALSTYDPYGTNTYKGMYLGDDQQARAPEMESLSKGATVGFKKRKISKSSATKAFKNDD